MGRGRRRAQGTLIAALGLVALTGFGVALAGCVPDDVSPSTSATESPSPVFATDDEALAAAEAAYTAYLSASDAMLASGGTNTSAMASVESAA